MVTRYHPVLHVIKSDTNVCQLYDLKIRPDLIDLFLCVFSRPIFEDKNKRKNRQKIAWKCKFVEKNAYFWNIHVCFSDFSQPFLIIKVQEDLRNNKSIETGLSVTKMHMVWCSYLEVHYLSIFFLCIWQCGWHISASPVSGLYLPLPESPFSGLVIKHI